VHQPLHAADDGDRGGNDVHVSMGHERASLHKVWDADVVQALGYDTDAIANGLERSVTPAQRKAWSAGTPAKWANESLGIARNEIYPRLRAAALSDYRAIMLSGNPLWRECNWPRPVCGWPGC